MTTIKHILQKEVFLPSEERLVGIANVAQAGKKKKSSKQSFLCAAVSTNVDGVSHVNVYLVKKSDKEKYKKKLTWPLRELKVLDGKDANKELADFDLHFEKVYKWTASSAAERNAFISCLWKHAQRHLQHIKPKFENVPEALLEEIIKPLAHGQSAQEGVSMVTDEEFQALSQREEEDLESLMSECAAAISNAETFTEQLSKKLSILDGANMHVIMGSEDQVFNLMKLLDDGIKQAEAIESKLDSYDKILQGVKEQMEMMKEKDTLMSVRNQNHQKLLSELENLVKQLDLEERYATSLSSGDLSTPNGILDCTVAAQQLQRSRHAAIHPALQKISAVEEQMRRFNQMAASFSKRLSHYLNNLFIHQGNEMGETLSRHSSELKLPPHNSSHRDLTPYTELMAWLKQSDRDAFRELKKVYTNNLSKLYVKEVQDFLETAKQVAVGKGDKSRLNISGARLSGSSASLSMPMDAKNRAGSVHSIDSAIQGVADAEMAMRHLFDQVFDKVLSELEPMCLAEQDFCCKFFHLLLDVQPAPTQSDEIDESEDTGDIWMKQKPKITIQLAEDESYPRRQINDEMRGVLTDLFPTLQDDLDGFIQFADRHDGFFSMYMLVRMSEHVSNTQDTGSFLSVTFASSLVKIKRNFDKFVQLQIKAIEENKVSKKAKCGIISFVHNFEDFANQAENIFRNSERRTDLEKAYQRLVRAIFDNICRIAAEHPKTPKEVIMMENFHHMYSILSQLKITCLENDRKEAKTKYNENLSAYTKERLGRPLEKLHVFVEGVNAKMNQGVKPEEVGFQLAFSKTELRKVIKEYTGNQVKKSLDHLYKKLEKHLSEEENLYEVVWVSMQGEFIAQYKSYEELIRKCYPDSNITLEFTIDNVLEFFSNIAQSH